MADESGPSSDNLPNSEINDDEKTNLYSENFDPLVFLLSDKAKIPQPKAKVYDNVSKWYSNCNKSGNSENRRKKIEKMDQPVRRWQPHQLPVESKKPQRPRKNLFIKMENMQGPLATLRKYMEEKTRIKIVTRNATGVRGYCIAYLLAFDKHFNLVLSEVDEFWHRSIKFKKNPLFTDVPANEGTTKTKVISNNKIKIPKINSKQISKNTEECTRHVSQMMMRGENVVLIHKVEK
ncbi:hypothetical protein ABEB36_003717 [Hypothenemus hampei]|uniref:Sm domain-containing protein n=1 Tax=Hypothenemus hampei TaxID=57062 RepID=A0ABD1F1H8_HYPHA